MQSHSSAAEFSSHPETRTLSEHYRGHPVSGSAITGFLPSEPQPRAAWASLLPVSSKSPAKARDDTEIFMMSCRSAVSDDLSDVAVLLVSELVTNAFKAMKMEPVSSIGFIELFLRLFGDRLLIEVGDSSPKIPAPNLNYDAEREGWRGLAVVSHLSQEWGYFWRSGRKIVFCTLSLDNELNGTATSER